MFLIQFHIKLFKKTIQKLDKLHPPPAVTCSNKKTFHPCIILLAIFIPIFSSN